MSAVLEQVRRTIEQHELFAAGETVVVGVSGGPDSLCLLHALCRLRAEHDLHIHVAHLHHGLRGAEADADADFVGALAADWGLPCTVEHADVPALAQGHRLAIEEAARRARYVFLARVAVDVGAQTIAVGHNADDQTETVLMHFIRGSGLAGLRGMLPRTLLQDYRLLESTGIPEAASTPDLHLVRPLLEVMRADIEAYNDFYGLEPRFDRSNLDRTYFRNWLRHEVLPLLAEHNPNVREVIRRSARVLADEYALLRSLLDEAWEAVVRGEVSEGRIIFDLAAWRSLPTALQRATLREAIHRLRRTLRNINFLHVENALIVARDGTTGDQSSVPRGLMLTVGYERFTIAEAGAGPPLPDWPLLDPETRALPVAMPGDTVLPHSEWLLRTRVLGWEALTPDWASNPDPWQAFLDADAVGTSLWLRTRRPGDRFQPLGMGGHTVKLADFLTNQKVPQAARDRLPLLVAGGARVEASGPGDADCILWVPGWRVDQRARVRDGTERVLVLRFMAWQS